MANLTPKAPNYFQFPVEKKVRRSKAEMGKQYKKRSRSLERPKIPQLAVNGLCKIARQLAGGHIPEFQEDATLKLHMHFLHGGIDRSIGPPCEMCSIPHKVALNSPERRIENILKKTLGDNLTQRFESSRNIDRPYGKNGTTVREILNKKHKKDLEHLDPGVGLFSASPDDPKEND